MENQGASGLQNLSGIVVILFLAGLWLLQDSPLTAKRPAIDADSSPIYQQDKRSIPARLWQDPFEAVERRYKQALQGPGNGGEKHAVQICRPANANAPTGVPGDASANGSSSNANDGELLGDTRLPQNLGAHTRLFVMIPGGPYAEDREFRRRLRYAMHSALSNKVEVALSKAVHDDLSKLKPAGPDLRNGGAANADATLDRMTYATQSPALPPAKPQHDPRISQLLASMDMRLEERSLPEWDPRGVTGVFGYVPPPRRGVDHLYYPGHSLGLWCWNRPRDTPGDRETEPSGSLPIIPYEDFSNPTTGQKLRLFWLKESYFNSRPLEMLSQLLADSKGENSGADQQTPIILGPWTSDTLEAMVAETRLVAQSRTEEKKPSSLQTGAPPGSIQQSRQLPAPRAIILSPSATKPDRALLSRGDKSSDLTEFFRRETGHSFLRTIPRNDALARTLIRELQLRGIDPVCSGEAAHLGAHYWPYPACDYGYQESKGKRKHTQHIVLIYEWDTAFARSLRDTFVDEVVCNSQSNGCGSQAGAKPTSPEWIHEFTYLRGLDGQLPVTGGQIRITGDAGKERVLTQDIDSPGNLEPAHGPSQFDYLRRLTQSIERLDMQLRDSTGGRERIRAFGILGSDFYDKLLILQALRERFPNHLYFTTDLDARFLDSENYQWTRNLVIASGFGLRMHRNWQSTTAPFRSGYETSFFFSIQLANSFSASALSATSQEKLDEVLRPLVFEVSRSGFVNLRQLPEQSPGTYPASLIEFIDPHAREEDSRESNNPSKNDAPGSLALSLAEIHPDANQFRLHPRFFLWAPVLAILSGVLLILTVSPLRRTLGSLWGYLSTSIEAVEPAKVREYRIVKWGTYVSALWLGGVGIFLFILFGRILSSELLEPLTFLAGVSIWPSEFLRLVASILCVLFIFLGMRAVFATDRSLESEFGLGGDTCADARASWLVCWFRFFSWCSGPGAPDPQTLRVNPRSQSRRGNNPEFVWCNYKQHAGFWSRATRILLWGAIFYAIGLIGVYGFEPPLTPHRGDFAFWSSTLIGLLVLGIPFLLLLFGTLDEALLSNCLIRHLTEKPMHWGRATKRCRKRMPGLHTDLVDAWVTVEFLAKRTAAASNLTYYPFIVILIILLSLSSRFDKWDTPASVLGIVGLCVIVAVISAALLRRTAQNARRAILDRIEGQIYEHSSATAPTESDRLKLLVERMRNLDEGAFRHWYQEPAVKALFWVVGAASLLLTEYIISFG